MRVVTDFHKRLKEECATSSVIVCLVSNAFLDSDYCRTYETLWAGERAKERWAAIVPVIIETCDWRKTWLKKFLASPRGGGRVVQHFDTCEEGFELVVEDIESALNDETRLKWMGPEISFDMMGDSFSTSSSYSDLQSPSIGGLGGALDTLDEGIHDISHFLTHAPEEQKHSDNRSKTHSPFHDIERHENYDDDDHADDDDGH
jgi:hypothetical protein